MCNGAPVEQGVVARSDFVYPSVWLLEQLLSTAKQSPYLYDGNWWSWMLIYAMIDSPDQTTVAEVLKRCNPPVIQSTMMHWIWLLDLPDKGRVQRTDLIDFKRMYGKLGHLHFKANRFNPADEDEDILPLSMAMQESQSFNRFRTILKELDIDIKSCVHGETDYLEDRLTEKHYRPCSWTTTNQPATKTWPVLGVA